MIGIRNYLYGWHIFARSIWQQCQKRHGRGRQPWRFVLLVARQQRWIVDGQHRGKPVPSLSRGDGRANRSPQS